jgi:hypothetical protein
MVDAVGREVPGFGGSEQTIAYFVLATVLLLDRALCLSDLPGGRALKALRLDRRSRASTTARS